MANVEAIGVSDEIKQGPITTALPETFDRMKSLVSGMGPDTPTAVNAAGASQSALPYHFHTGPVRALFAMAEVQKGGDEKYGAGDWRGIDIDEHINHAIAHLFAYLAGDQTDSHLTHALCRVAYAVEGEIEQKEGAPDDESE